MRVRGTFDEPFAVDSFRFRAWRAIYWFYVAIFVFFFFCVRIQLFYRKSTPEAASSSMFCLVGALEVHQTTWFSARFNEITGGKAGINVRNVTVSCRFRLCFVVAIRVEKKIKIVV